MKIKNMFLDMLHLRCQLDIQNGVLKETDRWVLGEKCRLKVKFWQSSACRWHFKAMELEGITKGVRVAV